MESWKRILLYAGGAAGAAAALYYLLREEPETGSRGALREEAEASKDKKKLRVENVTKEEVQEILGSIIESQEKMRAHMKALTKELLEKQMSFEQAYARVREVQPEDPLERHGLSMTDFDQLLNRHQSDPQVRQGIVRIMGVPDAPPAGEKISDVPASKTVEVHSYMLQELQKLLQHFHTVKNKESYDVKTVTFAAQAVIGAKVEEKYGLTSEDIERAVVAHHTALATDQEFASINMKMQQTMAQLMGVPEMA